jgi:hypothetical protein
VDTSQISFDHPLVNRGRPRAYGESSFATALLPESATKTLPSVWTEPREPPSPHCYLDRRRRASPLPSTAKPLTRNLAEQLDISRTVDFSLMANCRPKASQLARRFRNLCVRGTETYCACQSEKSAELRLSRLAAVDALKAVEYPRHRPTPLRYDFSYGRSDVETFPFQM